MDKKVIDLSKTELKTALKIMMAESGVDSFAELAKRIGKAETTFRSSINNKAIRLMDFLDVCKEMGYTLIVREKE